MDRVCNESYKCSETQVSVSVSVCARCARVLLHACAHVHLHACLCVRVRAFAYQTLCVRASVCFCVRACACACAGLCVSVWLIFLSLARPCRCN